MSNITLYQGDCLDYMQDMPDQSVQAIITDPPYGVGLDYASYEDTENNWERLFIAFVPMARRVARMVIMPSCRINKIAFIYNTYPPDWLICWHKGSPGTTAYIGFNDWEPILVYGKTPGLQMHDYFSVTSSEKKGAYGHPCPKPLKWATWLVSRATQEGDTVFDPFMGSGTTGVACMKLGRNFIGCEIDPGYFQIAKKRISEAQLQGILL